MIRLRTFLLVLVGSIGSLLLGHVALRHWEELKDGRPLARKSGQSSGVQDPPYGSLRQVAAAYLGLSTTNGNEAPSDRSPGSTFSRDLVVWRRPVDLQLLFGPLQALPTVDSDRVVRVLVVTYFRAGSTFLGEILQQNWKTFYHFEPLHSMTEGRRVSGTAVSAALDLFADLFRCRFANATSYLEWAAAKSHQFLFRRNHFLWATCRIHPVSCFSPDFVASLCRRAPVQIMKTTRLDMEHVRRFLDDNRDLGVRVVHLVRDPRGVISSRRGLDWCNETGCADPAVLCGQMAKDLSAAREMKGLVPLLQLRYEDVAVRPEQEAVTLYRRLGLPYTSAVAAFLHSHTQAKEADGRDPYSTRRNSSSVPFEWRRRLDPTEIARIQKTCLPVMERLGYHPVP